MKNPNGKIEYFAFYNGKLSSLNDFSDSESKEGNEWIMRPSLAMISLPNFSALMYYWSLPTIRGTFDRVEQKFEIISLIPTNFIKDSHQYGVGKFN